MIAALSAFGGAALIALLILLCSRLRRRARRMHSTRYGSRLSDEGMHGSVQMGRAGPFSDDQLESPQGYSYRDQPPRRPSRDGTGDRCARARPLSAGRVRSATTAPAPERPER
jgi:hypothetical protein